MTDAKLELRAPAARRAPLLGGARRRLGDRVGDPVLHGLCAAAALGSVVLMAALAWKVVDQAGPAISTFGLGFLVSGNFDPVSGQFGAGDLLYGTAVSSGAALLIAAPLSLGIALYLTELAPRLLRGPIGALVQLLAGIPSVVIGLWGILVLGPFVQGSLEPALSSALGWIPLLSGSPSPFGLLPAILVLTIMTVPIVSAVVREIFLTVPPELKEGALALGATRWEMVRSVMLPYARPGIVGAVILGLGRALGEAIAVTQVIGGTAGVHASLFTPADTLASRLASQYQGATSNLEISSLAYLAVVLLVLAVGANASARLIVRGVGRRRGVIA